MAKTTRPMDQSNTDDDTTEPFRLNDFGGDGSPPTRELRKRTRVGHVKEGVPDGVDRKAVYAGRGDEGANMNTVTIGTRGWLGNPHRMDDGYSRREAISLFRDDFEARLRGDDEFREAVRDLSGSVLLGWCQQYEATAPACHAQVIAEWADRLARGEGIDD